MYLIRWSTTGNMAQQDVPHGAARQSREASLHHCHTERRRSQSRVYLNPWSTTETIVQRNLPDGNYQLSIVNYQLTAGCECISTHGAQPALHHNKALYSIDRPTPPDEIHSTSASPPLGMTCYIRGFSALASRAMRIAALCCIVGCAPSDEIHSLRSV